MAHDDKMETYKADMAARGIGASMAVPPLWHLLWVLGINVPPPLFMPFLPLALLSGSYFGVLFGAFAWLMGNRGARSMGLGEASLFALATGALFGLGLAWSNRRLARRLGLGSWSAYGDSRLRT
jgi:hypothetical protein